MKIRVSQLTAFLFIAIACLTEAFADTWEPPESPDPRAILREARDDRDNGRYALALEKHVWFHENALDIRPSLTGVRTSFALFDWRQLANEYPPALEKLQQVRDRAAEAVRNGSGFDAFRDFAGINRALGEQHRTIELFKWLDVNDPSAAESAYIVAEDVLVAAAEYTLCGKYIGGIDSYFDAEYRYRIKLRAADDGSVGSDMNYRARKKFSYEIALQVALLVKNDKSAEASEIVDRALRDWEGHLDEQQILDAQGGVIPTRAY